MPIIKKEDTHQNPILLDIIKKLVRFERLPN